LVFDLELKNELKPQSDTSYSIRWFCTNRNDDWWILPKI